MSRSEDFINNVQNLPHGTKIKLLWAVSAFCMIVAVFAWVTYFNVFVMPDQQNAGVAESPAGTPEFSLWSSVKTEAAIAAQNIKSLFAGIGGKLQAGKDYEVSPQAK
ncbi:MAG: hypothetical protein V1489_02510 [Candidatus Liptonbacteria bacterium]